MYKKILTLCMILTPFCFGPLTFANKTALTMKSFDTLLQQKIRYTNGDMVEIPSPVYTFTGTLPDGATKLVLHRKGSKESNSFEIPVDGRKGIALDLRLDYENIWAGKNQYRISIRKGEQLKEIRFLDIVSNFKAKPFGNATLYLDEEKAPLPTNETNTQAIKVSYPHLVSYAWTYRVIDNRLGYNQAKQELYEYRNLQPQNKDRLEYGDLYINGERMIAWIPLIYHDTWGGNSLFIDHQKENAEVSLHREDYDGCGYVKWKAVYTNGEKKLWYEIKENHVDEGIVLEYGNRKIDITITQSLSSENGEYLGTSLDYTYFTRDGTEWAQRGERNLIPLTIIDSSSEADSACGHDAFVLGFNENTLDVSVKVDFWNTRNTYTRKYATLPSYYKTSP